MKKIIIILASTLLLGAVASAQPRALGVRATYGVELSYQHDMGGNFSEFDLGWSSGYTNLAAVYDFALSSSGNFNFYAGPGADLCLYDNVTTSGAETVGIGLGVVGQIGAEYEFDQVPVNLSLDWRPIFRVFGPSGFGWDSIALGIRYRF